ncbi:MAG: hypothetical protein F4034_11305 [Chloroflexi bacterium]|nr:hypothetical protein [Chloroflexota bacterium]
MSEGMKDELPFSDARIWMLRPWRIEEFIQEGRCGVDFGLDDVDLTTVQTRDALKAIYASHRSEYGNSTVRDYLSQVNRFLFSMQIDDYVLLPNSDYQKLRLGQVKTDPYYDAKLNPKNNRTIHWFHDEIERNELTSTVNNNKRIMEISHDLRDEFIEL